MVEPEAAIRSATAGDAPAVAELLAELGYPADPAAVAARLERLAATGSDAVYVAEANGRLLGLASLHITTLLHRDEPVGRITALVVRTDARGRGLGRALVEHAARAAAAAGCGQLEL